VDLEYEITIGGVVLALSRFKLVLDAESYELKVTIKPGGIPSILSSSKMKSQAEGLRAGAMIVPRQYRSVYLKRKKHHRSVKIDYGSDTISAIQADPTTKEDKRPPLTEPLSAGTLDPLSAALALLQEVAESGRCQGTRQVYDGRRLFHVQVQEPTGLIRVAGRPESLDPLPETKLLCRVAIGKVDGFRDKEIMRRRYPEAILAELAPVVPGGPWVPLRLTVEAPDSSFGARTADLVSAKWRELDTSGR
jgi:hypothetical protein